MLLTRCVCSKNRNAAAIVITLVVLSMGGLDHALGQQRCTLQLPVYDPTGARMQFRIVHVSPPKRQDLNLVDLGGSGLRVVGSGDTLEMPVEMVSRTILVSLEGRQRERLEREITILSCEQRTSSVFGQAECGADNYAETVKGKLVGCSFAGDWWVKSMPMFEVLVPGSMLSEAGVRTDGSFTLTGGMNGMRQIIVIGRGKEPVKTLAFNLGKGCGDRNIGTIDLRGACGR